MTRTPPAIMLLDGATGTELDRRGVNVSLRPIQLHVCASHGIGDPGA